MTDPSTQKYVHNPLNPDVKVPIHKTRKHDVVITDWKTGKEIFRQEGVEAPEHWSDTAINIACSRWFRGKLGTPEREVSTHQMFERVASAICNFGVETGHITQEDLDAWIDYLVAIQQDQRAVFNTPVYLNAGWTDNPRTSACFLIPVEDNYESLTQHTQVEARVFQHGGGAGVYVGNVSHEGRALSKGGYASGPLCFNEGWDRSSGAIKSGGSHRRAARDVTMDIRHPDCFRSADYLKSLPVSALDTDFIREKQIFEQIRKDLASLGHDVGMNTIVDYMLPAQNANRAVLVYDEFLNAVKENGEWNVCDPRTGERVWTYMAREVWDALCYATWYAADPTIKFFDNINEYNMCRNGRLTLPDGTVLDIENMEITTSNPCGRYDMRMLTRQGYMTLEELSAKSERGEVIEIHTGEGNIFKPARVFPSGKRRVCEIVLEEESSGDEVRLYFTPEHRFYVQYPKQEGEICAEDLYGFMLYDHNIQEYRFVKDVKLTDEPVLVYDFEMLEGPHHGICEGFKVHNCNEVIYPVPPVSGALISCNLAMLRLTKYKVGRAGFDVDAYVADAQFMLTLQDVLVDYSDYPTELGTQWTRANRILGLSLSDLGGLLMSMGIPYDSDKGRLYAEAVAALHFYAALNQSVYMASVLGPCENYERNKGSVARVLDLHRKHLDNLNHRANLQYDDKVLSIVEQASLLCAGAMTQVSQYGLRNMQVASYAPQGTTGMTTDCFSTGPEPMIAPISYKTLSGGGTITQAPAVVRDALEHVLYEHYRNSNLYKDIRRDDPFLQERLQSAEQYLFEMGTLECFDGMSDEYDDIFATALGIHTKDGVKLSIHPNGHVDMIGVLQRFVSGAISKCVRGDTYLFTKKGMIKIGSLYEDQDADTFSDIDLLTADRVSTQNATKFYYGGEQPTIKISLQDRREIEGTPNHPLLVMDSSGRLVWRELAHIGVGDYVACRLGANVWSDEDVRFDFIPKQLYGSQKQVNLPKKMTPELALIIGMMIADGSLVSSTYAMVLTSGCEVVRETFKNAVKSVFGVDCKEHIFKERVPAVSVNSKTIVEFMEHIGMKRGSRNKYLPDCVLQSTFDCIKQAVRGLFLDAHIATKNPKIVYGTMSQKLCDQVQMILLNAGVLCGREEVWNKGTDAPYAQVHVGRMAIRDFAKHFSFIRPRQVEHLDKLLNDTTSGHDTNDVVPFIRERLYHAVKAKGGLSRTTVYSAVSDVRTTHVSRRVFSEAAKLVDVGDLREIIDSNLYFRRVVSVEESQCEVFDISVPATESFLGNGVINHNTVNVPSTYTKEDISDIYMRAWENGVKAISIYRDGSKGAQPVKIKLDEEVDQEVHDEQQDILALTQEVERLKAELAKQNVPVKATRVKLPDNVPSLRKKIRLDGHEIYMHVGLYENGSVGEVFLTGVQGSFVAGMLDSFATLLSLGFQYGVPFDDLYRKFEAVSFAPQGWYGEIQGYASSLPSLILKLLKKGLEDGEFKRYAENFYGKKITGDASLLIEHEQSQVKVWDYALTEQEIIEETTKAQQPIQQKTSDPCPVCGSLMVRTGKCKTCVSCSYSDGGCG